MIKVKVVGYCFQNFCHICEVEGEAFRRKIDLDVMGEITFEDPRELIGRKFSIEKEMPTITIAHGVKEIK